LPPLKAALGRSGFYHENSSRSVRSTAIKITRRHHLDAGLAGSTITKGDILAFRKNYITIAARKAFERNREDVLGWIAQRGFDGEFFDVASGAGADSKINGRRFVSAYKLKDHTIIWITTGPERSTTLISMPYEIAGAPVGDR
jgi:hypothetical protein